MYLLLSFGLALHYILYVILYKILIERYNIKTILLHTHFCIVFFLLLLLLFSKSYKELYIDLDFNYVYILLFSIIILFEIFIWYLTIKNGFNYGIVEGIAIAIYLPIITLLFVYMTNEKIKLSNFIGICIIGIGAYLTMS